MPSSSYTTMDHDDDSHDVVEIPDSSRECTPEPDSELTLDVLPKPNSENTIDVAEETYQKINSLLDILDSKIQLACKDSVHKWSTPIHAAKPKVISDDYLIGIIGSTGAGKSAFLNAVLNEESLVPTSCMQACTAAVTEIAYNKSSVHEYQAIIEFASQESWHAQIRTLLGDTESLEDEHPEDNTSQAAIALAKLSAVYPDLNQETLSNFTADEIIARPGLEILGTSPQLCAGNGRELHAKLLRYVASKPKSQVLHDSNQKDSSCAPHDIEYWPLIRKIRIFVKADVLRTGCVLVDLPGVADINAARASIAQDYISKCAGLIVVVPIVRAVDDQVGRNILGERLKRQLRRDGTLGRVAVVCSKADQTFVHELKGSFASDVVFQARMAKLQADKGKYKTLKAEVVKAVAAAEKEKTSQSTIQQIDALQIKYDAYSTLLTMAKQGQKVRPPILQKRKRSAKAKQPSPQKRPKIDALLDFVDSQPCTLSGADNLSELGAFGTSGARHSSTKTIEQDSTQPEMDIAEVQAVVEETEKKLSALQLERTKYEQNLAFQRGRLDRLRDVETYLVQEEWDACYTARNESVVQALKRDFKLGIRDLVRAEMEYDGDFDPNSEAIRNAQDIDLPVFCTTSQAFQHLQGRLKGVKVSGELKDIHKTGIPEVMQYCIDIGEKEVVARRTLTTNIVSQLVASVRLRLFRDDNGVTAVLPAGVKTIQEITEQLFESIMYVFGETSGEIESAVSRLGGFLAQAAKAGEAQVLSTVRAWGASPRSEVPGLTHQTYRAVLRRHGIFPERGIDWIEDLLDPTKCVDRYWDATFNEAIPSTLKDANQRCCNLIDEYLTTIKVHDQFFEISKEKRDLFQWQFLRLKSILENVLDSTGRTISKDQRQAHLVFEGAVSGTVEPIFRKLAPEKGRGFFLRVKQMMEKEMNVVRKYVFTHAAHQVFNTLQTSFHESRSAMFKTLGSSLEPRRQDCQGVFAERSLSNLGITIEHQPTILETIHEIEKLLGVKTDAVNVDASTCSDKGQDATSSGDVQIKREPSLTPAEEVTVTSPASANTGAAMFVSA